jgi:polyhydroxyalkanoate synthase
MEAAMTNTFHVPDEFIQGFMKAGQSMFESFTRTYSAQLGDISPIGVPHVPGASSTGVKFAELQTRYYQQQMELWMGALARASGQPHEPVAAPAKGDRRFHGAEWRENPYYDFLKQQYLINARLISDMVETADVDEKARDKLRFYSRQYIDSMSPANFAATNPEVLKLALESKGETIKVGFENLVEDIRKGRISITDESAFEVGKNVAISQGAVVFENELIQLIEYAPATEKVAARPLLIVPPCINKFYILDLQPENSFVRYAVEQGNTVFVVSWRNIPPELGHTTWDDYLSNGVMKAIEVTRAITGADKVNTLGWCVGGTILSSALAVLSARGKNPAASLTLFTSMLDFRDPGELGIFIDEEGVVAREESIGNGGVYPGSELAFVFSTLRANDLIWPYVVNNYLKGKSPEAFDLLYWNADSTNLPGPMYSWYLRNMYLENNLRIPNKLTMCGVPVDLGKVNVPSYILATHEDHIVPWKSAYLSTQLLGGKSAFVLGASGHIAGVINPAAKNKRSYWIGGEQGQDPDRWFDSAKSVPGSWWPNWSEWLKANAGEQVEARTKLGSKQYPPIEPAPGRFVKVRND